MTTNIADIGQLVRSFQETSNAYSEANNKLDAAKTKREEAQAALTIRIEGDVRKYIHEHDLPRPDVVSVNLYINGIEITLYHDGKGKMASKDVSSEFPGFAEQYMVNVTISRVTEIDANALSIDTLVADYCEAANLSLRVHGQYDMDQKAMVGKHDAARKNADSARKQLTGRLEADFQAYLVTHPNVPKQDFTVLPYNKLPMDERKGRELEPPIVGIEIFFGAFRSSLPKLDVTPEFASFAEGYAPLEVRVSNSMPKKIRERRFYAAALERQLEYLAALRRQMRETQEAI